MTIPTGRSGPTCLADIVRQHARRYPDHPALIFGERTATWSELHRRTCRVANALSAAGVGRNDRVAFLDVNGIEHFEVLFGASLIGAIAVDVNWRLAAPEALAVVNDAAAFVLVAGQAFAPLVDSIVDQLTVSPIVVIGEHHRHVSYADWLAGVGEDDPGVKTGAHDVAFQLYTSGTTGRPKGVLLSNAAFFSLAPRLAECWELNKESTVLIALPLFHIGASGWATIALWAGGTVVIERGPDPDRILRAIDTHGVTHTVLVPASIQALIDVVKSSSADISSLRVIGYGAAPISPTLLARTIDTFDCKLWQGYGLTETGGPVTMLGPEDHVRDSDRLDRLRSCGRSMEGCEMRIVDPVRLVDVGPGEVGEILVRSEYLMLGYWNQPEETARVMVDGWFRTGDAAYLDQDGYLYLHDRIKDMIVSGGENIYPGEIENVLVAHPDVLEAAVIGVPNENWGETPKALIVRRGRSAVTARDLAEHCRRTLAGYKCPTSFEFVDSLPRNPTGKVLKSQLRRPYWRGRERLIQ